MRCNILVTNTSQSRNVRNERNIPDPGFYQLIEAHWLFLYTDRHRKLKFILQSGKKERYVPFPVFSISGTLLNFGQPDFINVQLIKDVYIYMHTRYFIVLLFLSLSFLFSHISVAILHCWLVGKFSMIWRIARVWFFILSANVDAYCFG